MQDMSTTSTRANALRNPRLLEGPGAPPPSARREWELDLHGGGAGTPFFFRCGAIDFGGLLPPHRLAACIRQRECPRPA